LGGRAFCNRTLTISAADGQGQRTREEHGASVIRSVLIGVLLLTGTLPWRPAEAADRFDVVVINHFMVRIPSTGGGFVSFSSGLIVNTGSETISLADLRGVQFEYVTTLEAPHGPSRFNISAGPEGLDSDLLPGEAFAEMTAVTDTLRTFLRSGERLRDTAPSGSALGCGITFPAGYAGTVRYDVAMTLAGQAVRFPVQVDIERGESALEIRDILRVSSSAVVPTLRPTWGRLKSLYR
jgi:hypothetical protein